VNQVFKNFVRRLRKDQTDAESRNRQFLGYKFRRQYKISRYVIDFCCVERCLVVEVDGSEHSESESDKIRDKYLKQSGYQVLRFWDHEVLNETEAVLNQIELTLQAPHP